MTTVPIAFLRDDFTNNSIDPAWATVITGSATATETGGQAVLTLPSSTVGAHLAAYQSAGTYDLTGDQFVWNIATMVATGVAATAYFQLLVDTAGVNQLYWRQLSNVITCRTVVAGVDTQLFTAAWSSTTYKYLRIRESAGTIFWDSSTNGTSWTNRASVANPFAVTALFVEFAVSCGNIASPGSLKLDDVNLILPALATNWRWIQSERPSSDYVRTITLAAASGQGYIATADSVDASGNLTNVKYYSGPMGSASGGYNQLTLASSQANAQAMAVNLPSSAYGRWDLPTLVQCRVVRLYIRSISGSSFTVAEFYPRRLVQADDIEAESIKAINIAAAAITADKIFVLTLGAITANIGKLNIDTTGYLYQGSGTGDAPTTGLKIFNSGGIGKLSTYNATVEQVTFDTDGILKAGAGNVTLDATGISVAVSGGTTNDQNAYKFVFAGVTFGALYGQQISGAPLIVLDVPAVTGKSSTLNLRVNGASGNTGTLVLRASYAGASNIAMTLTATSTGFTGVFNGGTNTTWSFSGPVSLTDSLSVARSGGSALFALDATSQGSALSIANNTSSAALGGIRNFSGLLIISETAVNGNCAAFLVDGGGNITLLGLAGATWSVTSGTAGKSNVFLSSGIVNIENKLGSTASYNIMSLRTRTS